jgi:hypothetical protein
MTVKAKGFAQISANTCYTQTASLLLLEDPLYVSGVQFDQTKATKLGRFGPAQRLFM